MIRVICSKCNMPANLPDSTAGKVAVCKCGQKNPIPKPAGQPVPQVAPAKAPPQAARPAAPQFSPIAIASAPAVDDDLALQDLDHDTGSRKENAPVPCPACAEPLPAGEIVCRHCGYVAEEGAMGKDKRVINKPRPKSWGGKLASELTALDFIKMAVSPQVFSAMVMLILRTIFAYLLLIFVAIGLSVVVGLVAFALPPIGILLVNLVANVFLASVFWGTIMKEPFAVCQAACFGYDSPKTNDWPTLRTGFFFVLLFWLPFGAAVLAALGGGGAPGAAVVGWLTAFFVVPVTFLSVAQSGGEWSGFNPIRVFNWLGRLILPYLGVAGIIFGEITVLVGAGVFGAMVIGLDVYSAQGAIDWGKFGMLAGLFLVVTILLLHPFVYGAAMLGMLYRKYERKLVG